MHPNEKAPCVNTGPESLQGEGPFTPKSLHAVGKPKQDILPEALKFLRRGLPMIPVGATRGAATGSSKNPCVKWKLFQERLPTEIELRQWQRNFAPSAWGIVTGALSKRIVLDFDGDEGVKTMQRMGLKPHVRTQSGGFHVHFAHPGYQVKTLNRKTSGDALWVRDFPGLDVRGDGGFAITIGTLHGSYEALRSLDEVEPWHSLPEDLRRHFDPAPPAAALPSHENPAPPSGERLLALALERSATEGRNNAGFWLATQLRDNGCTLSDASGFMRQYVSGTAATNQKGEVEPYTLSEALASLQQACNAPKREPWSSPSSLPLSRPEGKKGSAPRVFSGADLFVQEFSPPVFVVDSLLANGTTLLAARPKTGKSWLTLQLALSVAKGEPFLGHFPVMETGAVLYYALEESDNRTHNRLHKLTGWKSGLERISFVYRIDPLMSGGAAQIDADLTTGRFALVILDTLAAVLQPNARRDPLRSEYAEVNTLRRLAEKHKTCIVVVTHSRKAEADYALDAVAGTTGMTAGCDAVWVLNRQKDGNYILETIGRETEESVYRLGFEKGEPFGWRLLEEGAAARLTPARTQLLAAVTELGPATSKQLAERLNKSHPAICNQLVELSAEGLVVRKDDCDPPVWSVAGKP